MPKRVCEICCDLFVEAKWARGNVGCKREVCNMERHGNGWVADVDEQSDPSSNICLDIL